MPTNRAHGVAGQNSRAHSRRAGKQEKFQPRGVFFLDFPFYRTILEVFYYPRCRAALYRHLTAKSCPPPRATGGMGRQKYSWQSRRALAARGGNSGVATLQCRCHQLKFPFNLQAGCILAYKHIRRSEVMYTRTNRFLISAAVIAVL